MLWQATGRQKVVWMLLRSELTLDPKLIKGNAFN